MNTNQETHLRLEDFRFKKVVKQKTNPIKIEYDSGSTGKVQKVLLRAHTLNPIQMKREESILTELSSNRSNFTSIFEKIREMRKEFKAPADTLGPQLQPEPNVDEETRKFQILVSLILSTQTKDAKTASAMTKLKAHGFTLENISQTSEEKLYELIQEISFNKTKAKHIKKLCSLLNEDYNGRLPAELDEITKFPGVGNKVGLLYLLEAHKKVDGIAVDTHVHRISNRLNFVKTKLPEETRLELQSFIDKELWEVVNELLVWFGQTHCTAMRPKCESCKLNEICADGIRNMKDLKNTFPIKKVRTIKNEKKEEEEES